MKVISCYKVAKTDVKLLGVLNLKLFLIMQLKTLREIYQISMTNRGKISKPPSLHLQTKKVADTLSGQQNVKAVIDRECDRLASFSLGDPGGKCAGHDPKWTWPL